MFRVLFIGILFAAMPLIASAQEKAADKLSPTESRPIEVYVVNRTVLGEMFAVVLILVMLTFMIFQLMILRHSMERMLEVRHTLERLSSMRSHLDMQMSRSSTSLKPGSVRGVGNPPTPPA